MSPTAGRERHGAVVHRLRLEREITQEALACAAEGDEA